MISDLQDADKRIIPILKVLSESSEPLGSTIVSRELKRFGINLSARSVRYHFRITDIRGYTQSFIHDGRMLTPKGLEELKIALAADKLALPWKDWKHWLSRLPLTRRSVPDLYR